MESGAVLRSPAPEPGNSATEQPARWPWEHDPSGPPATPKIEAGPTVKTERLYRSADYPDASAGEDPFDDTSASAPVTPAAVPVAAAGAAGTAEGTDTDAAPSNPTEMLTDMNAPATAAPLATAPAVTPEKGISTVGVALIVAGITTAVGFVDMAMNRQFTWITGVAFIIASIIAALLVRRRDLWTAVITPPLAYLFALIVAGQPSTLTGTGSLLLREASLVATGLAFNAPYVFGGTIAALVIVLIRRSMFRRNRG